MKTTDYWSVAPWTDDHGKEWNGLFGQTDAEKPHAIFSMPKEAERVAEHLNKRRALLKMNGVQP